ncbi:Nicotinamide-nucleotide amidohydrolase PncC [Gammaproteobacteria bacterium]
MGAELYDLAKKVGIFLRAKKLFIATAESCTGGLLAATLTEVPGSSEYFDRGFITYSNSAKQEVLSVTSVTLGKFGAVSEQVAKEMAEGALKNSHAQIAVAITGIAGPNGGTENKPVGSVCVAWAHLGSSAKAVTMHFNGDRISVRVQAVKRALEELLQ